MDNIIRYNDIEKYRFEKKDIQKFYNIDNFDIYVDSIKTCGNGMEICSNIIYKKNNIDYIILSFLDNDNNVYMLNHNVDDYNDWKDLKLIISDSECDEILDFMVELFEELLPHDFWIVRSSLN